MYRRYQQNVMEMPAEDGISLLTFAMEKEEEDKLFSRWVGLAQYEVSFDEFKQQLKPVKVDEKKTFDMLDELMDETNWKKVPIRSE